MLKQLSKLFFIAFLTIVTSGCTPKPSAEDVIRVGTISGPETELMEIAQSVALRDSSIKIKIHSFEDYVTPNVALYERSIDANVFQHLPYLEIANEARGFDLVQAGKTFIYPMGVYSQKAHQLSDLKDGAKIGLPNDPSNQARSLLLFESSGLIKLRKGNRVPDIKDIMENPRHLNFIELNAAQLPRALSDLDAAAINTTYAIPAGLHLDDALLIEDNDSPYANIIVTTPELLESTKVTALVNALHSKEVVEAAQRLFDGTAVQAW